MPSIRYLRAWQYSLRSEYCGRAHQALVARRPAKGYRGTSCRSPSQSRSGIPKLTRPIGSTVRSRVYAGHETGATPPGRSRRQGGRRRCGYLTWRDSKASVIVFNTRNRNFSKILPAIPDAIRDHALFVRDLTCEETGEWRVLMRSEENEGRRVTVHIFLFDLYENPDAGRAGDSFLSAPSGTGGPPAAGTRDDRHAKLAARLRYAPPAIQLGRETVNALTFEVDQSPGAGQVRPIIVGFAVRCT